MATPTISPPKKGGFFGTPFIIITFILVLDVLFDLAGMIGIPLRLRERLGFIIGFLFEPIIGFGGRYPLLTIFLASVILVIATTAIRHFLTDWTKMARMQEAMRAFSTEMREARKSNNTYKLKKLTESQQELMQLQSSAQLEQLKPMALTMLIIIPIFAWLGIFLGAAVVFEADAAVAEPIPLVALDGMNPVEGHVLTPADAKLTASRDLHLYAFVPPGGSAQQATIPLENSIRSGDASLALDGAPALSDAAKVLEVTPGVHAFRVRQVEVNGTEIPMRLPTPEGEHRVERVVLLFEPASGAAPQLFVVERRELNITFTEAGALFGFIPARNTTGAPIGEVRLDVDGMLYPVGASNVLVVNEAASAEVHLVESSAPWNKDWSLLENYDWFGKTGWFPRWIVLYSLFGIPFGTIAQRALKLWEFRRVDLDADGVPAGKNL